MICIEEKSNCCGCTACFNGCPTKAIAMKEDIEGFSYPVVDKEKCIECGLCEKVCPMISPARNENEIVGDVYAIQNTNEYERIQSTAGGFFSVVADYILNKGGHICAAGWEKNSYIAVTHKIIQETEALDEMRGSKYVQSNLGDVFSRIRRLVKNGTYCLFVGTPCQVNAIRKYIGFSKLLITIDLLCLGVSSPKIFEKWMEYIEKKYQSQVSVVYFRDKSYGYSTANIRIAFSNGKMLEQRYDAKVYLRTFFHGYNMRPSCYDCKFRCISRVSDFTIGDYHQIGNVNKSMDDDKGTTKVWINSEEGMKIFSEISANLTVQQLNESHDSIIGTTSKLTKIPADRDQFYIDANEMGFSGLVKKWEPNSARDMLVNIVKPIVNNTPLKTVIFKAIKRRKAKNFEKRVRDANN